MIRPFSFEWIRAVIVYAIARVNRASPKINRMLGLSCMSSIETRATWAATEYFATRNFVIMYLDRRYTRKKRPVRPRNHERTKNGIMK